MGVPDEWPIGENVQQQLRAIEIDFSRQRQPPQRLCELDIQQRRRVPLLTEHVLCVARAERRLQQDLERCGCINNDHNQRCSRS